MKIFQTIIKTVDDRNFALLFTRHLNVAGVEVNGRNLLPSWEERKQATAGLHVLN